MAAQLPEFDISERMNYVNPYQPRRRGPSMFLTLGLVGVVVFVALGAYVVLEEGDQLLAFMTPDATPIHSTRPTSGAGSAQASTSPTSQPTNDSANAGEASPTDLFVTMAQTPYVPMHVEMSLVIDSREQGKGSVLLSVDKFGADVDGKLTMRLGSNRASGKIIVTGGHYYSQPSGSSAWAIKPNPDVFTLAATMLPTNADPALTYVGAETRGGNKLFHVRGSTLPSPDVTRQLRESGCPLKAGAVDFWFRENGTPVSASYVDTCEFVNDTQKLTINYEFSKVGEPITIQAPAIR